MDVPPRPGLRAGGYGSHSPERAGQMGSGRGFALALRLPKGAPSHRRRWFHAPFAATRRLQQACEPALESPRARLPAVRARSRGATVTRPASLGLLWTGRGCPPICAARLFRVKRYIQTGDAMARMATYCIEYCTTHSISA